MAVVTLSGGKQAVIALRMAEFRELWQSGELKTLQNIGEGGDLAKTYPILAKMVRRWDVTDLDGQPLDPSKPESYDEIEPNIYLQLIRAAGPYISGEEAKN